MTAGLQGVIMAGTIAARRLWPRVFTADPEVALAASREIPLMAAALVGDGVANVMSGTPPARRAKTMHLPGECVWGFQGL